LIRSQPAAVPAVFNGVPIGFAHRWRADGVSKESE
jgi:hypothetical protein